jgi:N-acetylglutamate synthase-like GNAT family acetyltransferase
MLVEGFDEMSNSLTIYNHEYYVKHMLQLGFRKDADWVEYQVHTPKEMNERINRLAEAIKKRYGYQVVKIRNARDAKPYTHAVFDLVNEAFEPLYGVVKLNEDQIEETIKQFITLINFEYCYIVTDKNDKVIGFGALTPSINKALIRSRGRLFPLGALRILRATKKGDVLDMYILAVKPEYQKLGVNALILCEGIKTAIKNKVKYAETGPELETNSDVRDQWKEFEARQHRRRRSWIIDFE